MKDTISSLLGFLIFGVFIAVALWFSAALIIFIFISGAFLAMYIILRGYYLRWRYKGSFVKPLGDNIQKTRTTIISKNTIVDVEYSEIRNQKLENEN